MFYYAFLLLAAILVFNFLLFLFSIFKSRSISKRFSKLYVIGYKNSLLYLGYPSDSKVSPVGFIPVVVGQCFQYSSIPPLGTAVSFKIKPVFSLSKNASNFRIVIK